MIGTLFDLPEHLRRRLTGALENGTLGIPCSAASLRSALGIREGTDEIASVLGELGRMGITASAAAAWIRSVEETAARTLKPDLVWSGPEVPGVHARDTRRVFEEILGSAEHS